MKQKKAAETGLFLICDFDIFDERYGKCRTGGAASARGMQSNKAESFMNPQKGYRWSKSCYNLFHKR